MILKIHLTCLCGSKNVNLAGLMHYADMLLFDGCRLNTALPSGIQELTLLEELDLSNNQIQGSIPEQYFSKLASMVNLNMSSNQLKGSIPQSIGWVMIMPAGPDCVPSRCWAGNIFCTVLSQAPTWISRSHEARPTHDGKNPTLSS